MRDKINWVDGEWTSAMKMCMLKLWNMYEDETNTRIHGNVEHAKRIVRKKGFGEEEPGAA
jgi:hypothetical protein